MTTTLAIVIALTALSTARALYLVGWVRGMRDEHRDPRAAHKRLHKALWRDFLGLP